MLARELLITLIVTDKINIDGSCDTTLSPQNIKYDIIIIILCHNNIASFPGLPVFFNVMREKYNNIGMLMMTGTS